MTATQDETIAELQHTIAELQREHDSALSEKAALAEELAARTAELLERKSKFDERIEYEAATVGVLKAMSASLNDTLPVFNLITRRAAELCESSTALYELREGQLNYMAGHGMDSAGLAAFRQSFPRPLDRSLVAGRAILERQIIHVQNVAADTALSPMVRDLGGNAIVAIPLLRDGEPIGAIALNGRQLGGFSDSQVALLKTFAEQAVIAITSAETYRALQTRTGDLQETLEYQTATSEVLKVISRSTFDLQPVLDTVAETAARLCVADQAALIRHEGGTLSLAANWGFPPEYEARMNEIGALRVGADAQTVSHRAIIERRVIHIPDVAAVPGYPDAPIRLGRQRTSLGVPLLREGEPVGLILLARQRVEPFTDRQIDLVSTFADQAVIAIENTRLLTEQQEALEQQTATAEVLQVINASPGDLTPVFDAILDKAHSLCGATVGNLAIYKDGSFHLVATHGFPEQVASLMRHPSAPNAYTRELIRGERFHQIEDIRAIEIGPHYLILRALVEHTEVRTVLFVPLRKDGALLGFISLNRPEVRPFSEKEIALLENFAAQAVIAMENARLLGELQQRTGDLQEALEYQTATSDVLKVISGSGFALEPVFQTVVDTAVRLCHADQAGIFRLQDDAFRWVAGTARLPEFERRMRTAAIRPGTGTLIGRVALQGGPVHILDAWTDPLYAPKDDARTSGIHTSLGVPLLRDGVTIGAIGLGRRRIEPFTDRQIELVATFADQAVIAIENARLITEQREALERQTATAEVLQVINSSPGNLAPVFDAMLEKAMRLCGGTIGGIFTFDGDHSVTSAVRGVTAAFQEYNDKYPMDKIQPGTVPARIIETRGPVQNPDLTADENYHAGHPYARALVELGGIRAVVAVPLFKDGVAIGMVAIYRKEPGAFTDKQIALLESFAAQAVIAMENARLIEEQREALEQQTATAEVLQVINASPGNLPPVFDAMLEKATRLCDAAFGLMATYDGEKYDVVATHGVGRDLIEFLRAPPHPDPESALGRIEGGEDLILFDDLADTDLYQKGDPRLRALVDLGGAHSYAVVALRKDRRLLGIIAAYRGQVRPFEPNRVSLLQSFAAQAVIAIENTRLIAEQREALEQQTATAEVLQVINTSPGDLAPVFDAMLEKAMRLCGVAFGMMTTFDGERFHPIVWRGLPAALSAYFAEGGGPSVSSGMHGRLVAGAALAHVVGMKDEEAYRSGYAAGRALVDLGGAQTGLAIALRKDDALLGTFMLYRQEILSFTDKQIALLQNFAAQAVIAMENARLINEQREALERQTATAEVLQVINANPGNLVPVFDAILEKAHSLCGAAIGSLMLYDGTVLRAVATRGYPGHYAALVREPFPPGTTHQALIRGDRLLHVPDMQAVAPAPGVEARLRLLTELGLRTGLFVPLHKDGVLLGIISAARLEVRPFSDKEIALLENFAAQAVIAMENARLLDEVRQRQEELRITFENMGDGVAMFDETLHLVAWNRKFQEILNVPDEVITSRLTYADYIRYLAERGEYGPGTDAEAQLRHFQERTREHYMFERNRPDGRVIEVRHNPVPGGGFVLIYADITERKRNEAEIRAARDTAEEASRTIEAAYRELKTAQANLIQAEKMASLGQLTAGIAHEIKNPLNFVNNFAALSVDLLSELKETAAPGFAALTEKQRAEIDDVSAMLTSNLEKITEHGKRADGIVKAMLEHSRGSSGERRVVDLNALIDDALNLAYHGARAQDQSFNITLERDFGAGMAPMEVNPQDMTRVFLNMFSNGFYAATRQARDGRDAGFMPTLKVTTLDAGEALEIRVRDNGTGIPADIRDKLFLPFFTTKPTGEGTGLGLSITYDIITQQHGGSITVDSEVGEYSEFTVRLPRKP